MRGFDQNEYESRTAKAQALMAQHNLGAMLLTSEPEIRYFTGFLTRFWESPSRPWFLVLPATGAPIAVIPSIGAALMGQTWVRDIRTWRAPDLEDDGISLLIDTLSEVAGDGPVALHDGHDSHLRMPYADVQKLTAAVRVTSDHGIMRRLRMVKSAAEISKIRKACDIAGRAFARVPDIAQEGVPLDQVFRRFQMLCLEEGADWVPYLAGGAAQGGYEDVISPARPVPLRQGDVLMLDTGLVWDGYFCDFDRNWSVGTPSLAVSAGHARLIEAVDAGLEQCRPGRRACDVFAAMDAVVSDGTASDAGRLGHGLGMSLTEWPSLIAQDTTELEVGMVLTLEPGVAIGSKIMVHEENILITSSGPEFLSPRHAAQISQL